MSICNTQPYTLEKYFLVLYGLFVIESDSDENIIEQNKIKKRFIEEMKKGMPENGYNEEELDKLLNVNIIFEWKPVLIKKAKYLSDEQRKEYGDVVRLAKKLIVEEYFKLNIEYSKPQRVSEFYITKTEIKEQTNVKQKTLNRLFNRR